MVMTPVPPIAGDQDRIVAGERHGASARAARGRRGRARCRALVRHGALHRDEARAEALEAGEVLVAGRLVDRALAAELGLERHDRDAVGLRRRSRRSPRRPAR